ncbi:MAG: biopolymer transporter ExbD [Elusimicrobia bacterium CG08_land_8_20_14_0_20_59_10]|nr:MAG: biopolymer transporter ExbD [Elusimicrobia bacterium CG08_land_8_20_14_0_20_59_10]
MAVSSGNSDDPITDINVTPLVDVCLVLVIIFMAVAPFAVQSGIKVLQSRAGVQVGKVSVSESVQIKLSKDGRISVNGAEVPAADFPFRIAQALVKSKDKFVIVKADEKNKVGDVVELLDGARQAGALKMALMKN